MQSKGVIASLLGLISVVAGALGAHYLKDRLPPETLKSFDTAVRFLFFHAITLLVLAGWSNTRPNKILNRAFRLLFSGTLLFSGSIFLLVIGKLLQTEQFRILGPITPLGGILLMLGWCYLIAYFAKPQNHAT